MAGTRTTPPPIPNRPTSTPTPRPSRRIMNIMVTGLFCAHHPDDSNPARLFSPLRASAATSLEQAVTPKRARLFLFVPNLLYLLVSFTSELRLCWPSSGSASGDDVASP